MNGPITAWREWREWRRMWTDPFIRAEMLAKALEALDKSITLAAQNQQQDADV